jgi:hypothetical protein
MQPADAFEWVFPGGPHRIRSASPGSVVRERPAAKASRADLDELTLCWCCGASSRCRCAAVLAAATSAAGVEATAGAFAPRDVSGCVTPAAFVRVETVATTGCVEAIVDPLPPTVTEWTLARRATASAVAAVRWTAPRRMPRRLRPHARRGTSRSYDA